MRTAGEMNEDITVKVKQHALAFLELHSTSGKFNDGRPLAGEFALHRGQSEWDLYGMVDAVYTLFTLGELRRRTTQPSRQQWAERILSCQDEHGWFSKRNLRGHSIQHATAYAIGALQLLACEDGECYVEQMRPLIGIYPLLESERNFQRWLEHLDFQWSLRGIRNKRLGWHYIWRGSHVGGGIAAAIGMSRPQIDEWWPGKVDVDRWFDSYFSWLNAKVNPNTGFWQRAFWNRFYKAPTLIDMGGAVHFFWIYDYFKQPFPFAKQVIHSTVRLQKASGLYKKHPFCIDLDGNFCIIRSFLQLPVAEQAQVEEMVGQAIHANFDAVATSLITRPLYEIYNDSHGLPGALAALVECAKLPSCHLDGLLSGWQHPLDKVCWL